MTYGWAILIIAVVGVALWQLGILSPSGGTNTATGFYRIKVLDSSIRYSSRTSFGIPINNSLNFTIVNGAGDLIRIDYIRLSGDCNATVCAGDNWRCSDMYLAAGKTIVVEGNNCSELYTNENFYVTVNISYSQKLGMERIDHFDSGTLQGVAE